MREQARAEASCHNCIYLPFSQEGTSCERENGTMEQDRHTIRFRSSPFVQIAIEPVPSTHQVDVNRSSQPRQCLKWRLAAVSRAGAARHGCAPPLAPA